MLTVCKQSRQKDHEYLDNQRTLNLTTNQKGRREESTDFTAEGAELTEAEEKNLIRRAVELCEKAERQHQWNLVVEANTLRARGKEKRKSVEEISEKIEEIPEKKMSDCNQETVNVDLQSFAFT